MRAAMQRTVAGCRLWPTADSRERRLRWFVVELRSSPRVPSAKERAQAWPIDPPKSNCGENIRESTSACRLQCCMAGLNAPSMNDEFDPARWRRPREVCRRQFPRGSGANVQKICGSIGGYWQRYRGASRSWNVAGFGYVQDKRLAGANLLAVDLLVGPE